MNNYMDYEKISDVIMSLGYRSFLKMNVVLGRKDTNNKRVHFYKEFTYNSNKYTNMNSLQNITRNFDYFLSIEKYNGGAKDFIMIREENIMELRYFLNQIIYPWLVDKDVFENKDTNLWMLKQGKWERTYCTLSGGRWLCFEPILITNVDNTNIRAIRMYLNSEENFIDIPMNKFSGFLYNINSIYLFQCAQNMLNFLQRPELGTNNTTYNYHSEYEDIVQEDNSGGADSIHKGGSSVIMKKNTKSIFDQIDNI